MPPAGWGRDGANPRAASRGREAGRSRRRAGLRRPCPYRQARSAAGAARWLPPPLRGGGLGGWGLPRLRRRALRMPRGPPCWPAQPAGGRAPAPKAARAPRLPPATGRMRAPTAWGRRAAAPPPGGRCRPRDSRSWAAGAGVAPAGEPMGARWGSRGGPPALAGGAERSGAPGAKRRGRTAARGPGWPPMLHAGGGRRGGCAGCGRRDGPERSGGRARRVRAVQAP